MTMLLGIVARSWWFSNPVSQIDKNRKVRTRWWFRCLFLPLSVSIVAVEAVLFVNIVASIQGPVCSVRDIIPLLSEIAALIRRQAELLLIPEH